MHSFFGQDYTSASKKLFLLKIFILKISFSYFTVWMNCVKSADDCIPTKPQLPVPGAEFEPDGPAETP